MLVELDSLDLSYSTVGIDPGHVHDTVMASFELCVLTVESPFSTSTTHSPAAL